MNLGLRKKQKIILGVFSKALSNLRMLNDSIKVKMDFNKATIEVLETENTDLSLMHDQNEKICGNIAKLIGEDE